MYALLLAAGLGSRLRPITNTIPKCLVPINGRPLLDYWIEILTATDHIEKIFINTHYLPEPIIDYVASSPHRGLIEIIREDNLLGTGGTLRSLAPRFRGKDVIVAHADNLTLFNLGDFILSHKHRPESCLITMMSFDSDNPRTCGIISLDRNGVVQDFHEKVDNPPSALANGAVFIFSEPSLGIIDRLSDVHEISVDIIPRLLGRIYTFKNDIYHRDIGSLSSLAAAELDFADAYRKFKSARFKK